MKAGNSIALEFTTTACNRPDILESTYLSYTSRLKKVDFKNSTLYLNVDPTPTNTDITKVELVAKKYFGTVIVNYPETPNFSAAAYWCFSQVKGPYFFHLEDDWNLCRPIDINELINKLNDTTFQCILNKKRTKYLTLEKGEPSFVPSLISTEIWKKYLENFDTSINPEYQFKKQFQNSETGLAKFTSVYYNERLEVSKDIGRGWLKRNKIRRKYANGATWSPWINWKI